MNCALEMGPESLLDIACFFPNRSDVPPGVVIGNDILAKSPTSEANYCGEECEGWGALREAVKTLEQSLLDEVVQRLAEEFRPEQIFLFGSHAWGQPTEDSDVDLLVIVSASDERPAARAARAYRCLRKLLVPAEVLVKTRAELARFQEVYASLECQILERGKVLYQRETERGAPAAEEGGA